MKLAKSLLLGSAAGLAVVSGASAADLPSSKAAPAEYVRVCSAYGAGFFYIPGTDVCLKVGGYARYQMQYGQPFTAANSSFGTRSQLRVELDARNPTAYGTLRAFVRLDVAFRTGSERSGSAVRQGYAFDNVAANDSGSAGRAQTQVIIDKAFVQWGGLVAGRTNSLFEYNKSPELIGTLATSGLYPGTNLIGYIATFGSGFYASVSLEDAVQRREAFSNAGVNAGGGLGGNTITFAGVNGGLPQLALAPNAAGTVAYYGGFRMPDIVGALGVDQSWGGAQLSAAVHQIPVNSGGAAGTVGGVTVNSLGVGPFNSNISSKYGWALSAGVMFKLDMLAPGDYLWLTANYADGAMSYVHSGWFAANLDATGLGNSHGYWQADAYINPLTGGVSTSKTWSVAGAFQHYWTPTLRSAFFGSYAQFNNPGSIADWDYWNAGANIVWSPIRAVDIGIEAAYQHIRGRHVALPAGCAVLGGGGCGTINTVGLKNADGAWTVRFRVQRSF